MRAHRERLLACADREDEIARRIGGLYRDAADLERTILERNSDIGEINRRIFGDRPLNEQFTIQAQGERLGAATWRRLAAHEADTSRRDVLLSCAELEEASAGVLEGILMTDR